MLPNMVNETAPRPDASIVSPSGPGVLRAVRLIARPPGERPSARNLAEITGWLLGPARALAGPCELVDELSWRLLGAGLPVARTTVHIRTLHPQFAGMSCRWQKRTGMTDESRIAHGVRESEVYLRSPLRPVFEAGEVVRRRIHAEADEEFPVFGELHAEGLTDYVAAPLTFADGQRAAFTAATDRPDGFAEDEVAALLGLVPALAAAVEFHAVRQLARNLLDVYLGRQAGARVLSGAITRGSGESIRAILLMTDLCDFTALSDRLPGETLIALLNAHFEGTTAAVHAAGGEVLKFIGDGMLAIFPVEDAAFAYARAHRALDAARGCLDSLDALNAAPPHPGVPRLRMAAALHFGEVVYGNIGGADRLDFTAIGPAVNLLSRLQQIAKGLDVPLLTSDDFARVCERPLTSCGIHPIRGLEAPREVFTLGP